MAGQWYIALLHYPVYNRNGDVVATAITNMDIHDISRAARTYGVRQFYIVTPIASQRELAEKILAHWRQGYGAIHNPSRREAFRRTAVRGSLQEVRLEIASATGIDPRLVVTGANLAGEVVSFASLREKMKESSDPLLLVFGTGSGIADEVLARADFALEPIRGDSDYNHLSVRSAVAIVLDRLSSRDS